MQHTKDAKDLKNLPQWGDKSDMEMVYMCPEGALS